jgi:hypothetical protein
MSDEDKKLKIVFTEGFFDSLDEQGANEEEIQELLTEIKKLFDSGALMEDAELIDMDELQENDPELYEKLMGQLDDEPPILH